MEKQDHHIFVRRIVSATFIIALMIIGFWLVGHAVQFFLLLFGAILFAVLLRAGTNFFKSKLRTPDWLGLTLTTLIFFGIIAGIIILIIPTVTAQTQELQEAIPQAWKGIKDQLSQYEWGRSLLDGSRNDNLIPDDRKIIQVASTFFTALLSLIGDVFILFIIGIFFAASPQLYQQGIIVLVAPRLRPGLEKVMNELYYVLKSWLIGKLLTMLFVGVTSTIALIILGVPMAFALGFIAFLLDFIPTIGPIIAAIPAILAGLLISPVTALLVAIIFFVIQSIESYVIVPIIYKRTVAISPVVTLASLVLFGILAGALGIILATPLVAAVQIIVKELYIKAYLEKDLPETSENSFESRMKGL